jgi:hypothetical protein
MTWIPVSERLPPVGRLVLTHSVRGNMGFAVMHYHPLAGWRCCTPDAVDVVDDRNLPTHWKELPPEPPRKPTKDEALREAIAFLENAHDDRLQQIWGASDIISKLKEALD